MATYKIDWDEPITLYKLRADGESADTVTVLGKEAYDEYMNPKEDGKHFPKEGWMDACPKLRYPLALYRRFPGEIYGDKMTVHSRDEENAALKDGWVHEVMPGRPPALEAWEQEELESQNRRRLHREQGMGQVIATSAVTAGPSEAVLADALARIRELEAKLAAKPEPPKKRGRPYTKRAEPKPEPVTAA